jgi:hypothetical protein
MVFTEISGQLISPIVEAQVVKAERLTREDWIGMLCRNFDITPTNST